jgi:cytochrome c
MTARRGPSNAIGILGVAALVIVAACAEPADGASRSVATPSAASLGLGRPASPADIAPLDLDVNPAGVGLPAGSATAVTGTPVYLAKCASCHGVKGEGVRPSPALVGRIPGDSFPFGRDPQAVKTVGNYWPYATTLYDYVRRAMPTTAPGSLEPNEIYGVVAYILAENGIIARDAVIDATTLPQVRMPSRDRFVRDDRRGGREIR